MFLIKIPFSGRPEWFNQLVIRGTDVGCVVSSENRARAKRFASREDAETAVAQARRMQADRPAYARNRFLVVEVAP